MRKWQELSAQNDVPIDRVQRPIAAERDWHWQNGKAKLDIGITSWNMRRSKIARW